jgi:glyoxylase-like metal-dependent hydrolase (beta-lactamase superfamily II)
MMLTTLPTSGNGRPQSNQRAVPQCGVVYEAHRLPVHSPLPNGTCWQGTTIMAQQHPAAIQLADDLWAIDVFHQGQPGVIASYLLTGPAGAALVDVGPGAAVPRLLAGIRAAGVEPASVEHLVLTHVHLDHAGATGTLLRQLPRARAYVHSIGAPHLISPERLVASARRIYGEAMETLWGEILPVPAERLVEMEEGMTLPVGQRELRVLYTPGHAVHHVAFHDQRANVVFAGDVAGVRLAGAGAVRPPTPPPDLSLEDWEASITRVEALDPRALYLAHFGPVEEVATHLAALRTRLRAWAELALAGMRAGETAETIAERLAADLDQMIQALPPEERAEALRRVELASNHLMSAQGFVRYFTKHHPELLAG